MKTTRLPATLLMLALSTALLAAAPKEGDLVEGSKPGVFLIKDGKRRSICSLKMLAALGLKTGEVIKLSDDELNAIDQGPDLTLPYKKAVDGDLILGDGPPLYLIQDGKRRAVSGAHVVKAHQLDMNQVLRISRGDMNLVPKGEPLAEILVPYKNPVNGDIVKGSSDAIFLIKDGKRCGIESPEMFKQLGLQWEKLIRISDEDLEAIPEGVL